MCYVWISLACQNVFGGNVEGTSATRESAGKDATCYSKSCWIRLYADVYRLAFAVGGKVGNDEPGEKCCRRESSGYQGDTQHEQGRSVVVRSRK